jgi:Protein of unknown function (DUF2946)
MSWFRSNLRSGAWCALLALALQLVFSFGHVHLDGLGKHQQSVLGWSVPAPASDEPTNTPKSRIDHHACVVCRLIHLADTVVPSAPPSLPLPVVVRPIAHAVDINREPAPSPPLLFNARAPPLA